MHNVNGGTPFIEPFTGQIRAIKNNIKLPLVDVTAQTNMSGFRVIVKAKLTKCTPMDPVCGGGLCGGMRDLMSNGSRATKARCGCAEINSTNTVPICRLDLQIEVIDSPSGNSISFTVTDFVSRKMTDEIFFSEAPASGTKALQLINFRMDLGDCIEEILDYVNNLGGWIALGWNKKGMVVDHGAPVQQGTYGAQNAPPPMIPSGNDQYHIVSLEPADPTQIDYAHMRSLAFNPNTLKAAKDS